MIKIRENDIKNKAVEYLGQERECKCCGKTKPLTAEYWHVLHVVNPRGGEPWIGFNYTCKICRNLKKIEYNKKNKEKIRLYNETRTKKWRKANGIKRYHYGHDPVVSVTRSVPVVGKLLAEQKSKRANSIDSKRKSANKQSGVSASPRSKSKANTQSLRKRRDS